LRISLFEGTVIFPIIHQQNIFEGFETFKFQDCLAEILYVMSPAFKLKTEVGFNVDRRGAYSKLTFLPKDFEKESESDRLRTNEFNVSS
jgi:hypothetical protein